MALPGGVLATIGHTPVARLGKLVGPDMAEVVVKLEGANPTGSFKDRMALAMIEGAERSGRLRPGQTVVEYTGGSTGSSLALVCALKGYPLRIVTADAFAEEKILTMRAFGATVEVLDSPDGITPQLLPRMMARAREIVAETGGYATDQFNNRDMIDGYLALGHELAEQVDKRHCARSREQRVPLPSPALQSPRVKELRSRFEGRVSAPRLTRRRLPCDPSCCLPPSR